MQFLRIVGTINDVQLVERLGVPYERKAEGIARALMKWYTGLTVRPAPEFYASDEWKRIRYRALAMYPHKCMCCGQTEDRRHRMHVDHILPRSLFPALELAFDNLQILCEDCNVGKSNHDFTDWRSKAQRQCAKRAT
jgi:5-methylcytosine-specific restriction endonuclease McrA